jgi:hypothetical protein
MNNGTDRRQRQRTVADIFAGVRVPEAGYTDEHGPEALLLLRKQIARTIDRLVMVGADR